MSSSISIELSSRTRIVANEILLVATTWEDSVSRALIEKRNRFNTKDGAMSGFIDSGKFLLIDPLLRTRLIRVIGYASALESDYE